MQRDLIGGIGSILIGASYLGLAMQLRTSALADTVGPAGFPKALGYAMIGLGVILCIQALLARRSARQAQLAAAPGHIGIEPAAVDPDRPSGLRSVARAGGMLLLGIGYLLVVRYLGYIISVALLMVAATLYLGTPFTWRVPVIAIAGALVYWVVFVLILGIPLPAGPFAGLF